MTLPSLAAPRPRLHAVFANVTLAIITLLFLLPLIWLVLASLDPGATLSLRAPERIALDNFVEIGTWELTFRPMMNGLIISGLASLLVVVLSALAAYPLSRYTMRYGDHFLYTVLFLSALPVTAIMIPVYTMFVRLRLVDSFLGCILFLAASSLPFAIWMMKNFMDGIPIEFEEAAWLDGASSLRTLRTIVLPLMTPGLAAVSIFQFILMWGNFFVPFILLLDPAKLPMAVTLYQFFGSFGVVNYGNLAAYAAVYSAPVIVLYLVVSRVFNGAFRLSGGAKG
ncbi:carbohydrate ABC transporter permease [Microcella pacifica]|uniref:Carbohydrate ABC transporter permease n=1 Tax=Microcella pacifica TaxID=2591847 RepID=A0A9E5JKU2_9MICO|nr:carbohydrate ABC transporter permease [Microcella pacifica]NHF62335.1 carbohydrate ABC transporter permease [Microcella pacifica]